ncbi:hypothetical protein [Rubritalea squalenifaciens]|uniref:hypothetical protein n=1 Tax=Rubritalea squalenifaciens TaxID=407226 RepID=UPI0011601FCF|nr:hypothetical protein [Rubritalea squalenifaciens]
MLTIQDAEICVSTHGLLDTLAGCKVAAGHNPDDIDPSDFVLIFDKEEHHEVYLKSEFLRDNCGTEESGGAKQHLLEGQ